MREAAKDALEAIFDNSAPAHGHGGSGGGMASASSSAFPSVLPSAGGARPSGGFSTALPGQPGYDPRSAITLWQKMSKVGGKESPKFMSTHPPRAERVQDLTNYSARVLPLYEEAKAKQ